MVIVLSANKDGQNHQACWKSTQYEVTATISQGLADAATVARVTYEKYVDDYSPAKDGMEGEDTLGDAIQDMQIEENAETKGLNPILWDMTRPLVGPVAKLELLKFYGSRRQNGLVLFKNERSETYSLGHDCPLVARSVAKLEFLKFDADQDVKTVCGEAL
jgi:hypothetical protein